MPLTNKAKQKRFRDKQKQELIELRKRVSNMLTKVYSINDSKAGVFNPPFLQNTHGEAERTFNKYAHDPKSMISQYPEDYHLYYLGEFDDSTGKYNLISAPQHVVAATQVLSKRNEAAALNS